MHLEDSQYEMILHTCSSTSCWKRRTATTSLKQGKCCTWVPTPSRGDMGTCQSPAGMYASDCGLIPIVELPA